MYLRTPVETIRGERRPQDGEQPSETRPTGARLDSCFARTGAIPRHEAARRTDGGRAPRGWDGDGFPSAVGPKPPRAPMSTHHRQNRGHAGLDEPPRRPAPADGDPAAAC